MCAFIFSSIKRVRNYYSINSFYLLSNTAFRSAGLNKVFGSPAPSTKSALTSLGKIRLYSTQVENANNTRLDPWFVTGFCDGE